MAILWGSSTSIIGFVSTAFIVGLAFRILISLCLSIFSPLRSVPGPFSARFGRLYFFAHVARGRWEHDNIALHRKYGPVVRVGSDLYSIDSPEVTKKVYGIGSNFPKSDWYDAQRHPAPAARNSLFSDRDIQRHAETRRRFQSMYSLSSLINYEAFVDECGGLFEKRLDEFASKSQVIDMSRWFQYYAFDVSVGHETTVRLCD